MVDFLYELFVYSSDLESYRITGHIDVGLLVYWIFHINIYLRRPLSYLRMVKAS